MNFGCTDCTCHQDPFAPCPYHNKFHEDRIFPISTVADCNSTRGRTTVLKTSRLSDMRTLKGVDRMSERMPPPSEVDESTRRSVKKRPTIKRSTVKHSTIQKTRQSEVPHPKDCGCVNCDRSEEIDDSCDVVNQVKKDSKSKVSMNSSVLTKSDQSVKHLQKSLLHDLSEFEGSRTKISLASKDEEDEANLKVWLLYCPRNFDPRKMLGSQMGMQSKAELFGDEKILVSIAAEKAVEYKLICENIKMVKPVGKIVFSGKSKSNEDLGSQKKSIAMDNQSVRSDSQSGVSKLCETDVESDDEQCYDEDPKSEPEVKHIGGKSLSKKLNDQRFTIETTVTVEKNNDYRKSKKISGEICLPFVPPEPSPIQQKKKSKRYSMI